MGLAPPHNHPVVLSFNVTDPTGGIGIQADIETCSYLNVHCAPIITAISVQDTADMKALLPLPTDIIINQARAVLEDMPVTAFKVGMVVTNEGLVEITNLLLDYPQIPVVLDPMLRCFRDTPFEMHHHYIANLHDSVCPLTTCLTCHQHELLALATTGDTLSACAQDILNEGCGNVLVTRVEESANNILNTLFSTIDEQPKEYVWERIPGQYRGAGCTLGASVAACLAQGLDPLSAVREGQAYTWQTLKNGLRLGMGKPINCRGLHSKKR